MIYPAPKPTGRKRSRKKGSAFPKQRDRKLCAWVRSQPCILRDRILGRPLSYHDVPLGLGWTGYAHRCWGAMTTAHVGRHRATGAPDRGHVVPMCQAAHQYYDEHRASWAKMTGVSAEWLQTLALDCWAQYIYETEGRGPPEFLPLPTVRVQP